MLQTAVPRQLLSGHQHCHSPPASHCCWISLKTAGSLFTVPQVWETAMAWHLCKSTLRTISWEHWQHPPPSHFGSPTRKSSCSLLLASQGGGKANRTRGEPGTPSSEHWATRQRWKGRVEAAMNAFCLCLIIHTKLGPIRPVCVYPVSRGTIQHPRQLPLITGHNDWTASAHTAWSQSCHTFQDHLQKTAKLGI